MAAQGSDGSMVLAGEDHPVWAAAARHLARARAADSGGPVPIDVRGGEGIEALKAWLRTLLPHSSKFLRELDLMRASPSTARVVVDALPEPSAVAVIRAGRGREDLSVFAADPAAAGSLAVQLPTPGVTLLLSAMDNHLVEGVCEALQLSRGMRPVWREDCGLFVMQDDCGVQAVLQTMRLPPGYSIGPLRVSDARTVEATWKYRNAESLDMVRRCIWDLPSAGVRYHASAMDEEGQLVSWCLTYKYGAIGLMYTVPEHRGRRLARLCAASVLARLLSDRSASCAPFAFVVNGNEPSMRLLSALGFSRVADQCWAGVEP